MFSWLWGLIIRQSDRNEPKELESKHSCKPKRPRLGQHRHPPGIEMGKGNIKISKSMLHKTQQCKK